MSDPVRTPESKLHAAICQAVTLLNTCPEVARTKEGREANNILRQALVEYADDFMNQPSNEAEQLAMRRKHSKEKRS